MSPMVDYENDTDVVVLVPVLNRPHRVAPLVESLRASLVGQYARLLFIVSPGDDAELAAVQAVTDHDYYVVDWPPGPGDYARKLNHAFAAEPEMWKFLAADDIVFHAGWLEVALAEHERTGACVVGTNDLKNRRVMIGRHSTHTLVHRDYAECGTVDDPTRILHEGYGHWWVDDEFVQTAQYRGTFAHAHHSHVEHLHPVYDKTVPEDDTYLKGQATVGEDSRLFKSRCHMWGRSGDGW